LSYPANRQTNGGEKTVSYQGTLMIAQSIHIQMIILTDKIL